MKRLLAILLSLASIFTSATELSAKERSWTYLEYRIVGQCASAFHNDLAETYFNVDLGEEAVLQSDFLDKISDCLEMYRLPKSEAKPATVIRHFLVATKGRVANCVVSQINPSTGGQQLLDLEAQLSENVTTVLAQCDPLLAEKISSGDEYSKFLFQVAAQSRALELAKMQMLWSMTDNEDKASQLAACSWDRALVQTSGFYTLFQRRASNDVTDLFRAMWPPLTERCQEFAEGVDQIVYFKQLLEMGQIMERSDLNGGNSDA